MDTDQINIGPDASLENFVIRTARTHTNSRQHGARRVDLYRTLPEKFETDTPQGREDIADVLATLVEDDILEAVAHDGTIYYRLAGEK